MQGNGTHITYQKCFEFQIFAQGCFSVKTPYLGYSVPPRTNCKTPRGSVQVSAPKHPDKVDVKNDVLVRITEPSNDDYDNGVSDHNFGTFNDLGVKNDQKYHLT